MSQQRFLLVNAALIVLIVGHLYHISQDREHWPFSWPFSQYTMFQEVQHERSFTRMELYGVMQEDSHQEFPLRQVSGDFDEATADAAGREIYSIGRSKNIKPEERQQMLDGAMHDALSKYERRRLAGEYEGPPLQGIRLYRATWQLDDPAKSKADPPDQLKLMHEVARTSDQSAKCWRHYANDGCTFG